MTDSDLNLEDLLSSIVNPQGGDARTQDNASGSEEKAGTAGAGESSNSSNATELEKQLAEEKAFAKEKIQELEKRNEELAAARLESEELNEKFAFIASVVEAQPEQNSGLVKFRKLLDEDYQKYANSNAFLTTEAKAMKKLLEVQYQLELVTRDSQILGKTVVALAGAFSSGKSSFMNSFFMHDNVTLPVGMDQTTAIASYVLSGENTEITGYTYRGAKVDVPDRIFSLFAYQEKDAFRFNMKHLIDDIVFRTEFNHPYENICFIDTPGFNSGSGSELDYNTAITAISGAQVLLWCFDVRKGTIDQNELTNLRTILDENPHIRIYFIANMAEVPSDVDNNKTLDEVENVLKASSIPYEGINLYTATENFNSQPARFNASTRGKPLAAFLDEINQEPDRTKQKELQDQVQGVFDEYIKADDQHIEDTRKRIQALNSIESSFIDVIGKKDEAILDYKSRTGRRALSGMNADSSAEADEGMDAVSDSIAEIKKGLQASLQRAADDKTAAEELCRRFQRCIKNIFGNNGIYGSAKGSVSSDAATTEPLDADGQFNLGEKFYNGLGAELDYGEALDWYLKSAEQGNAKAQYRLGQMYGNGLGTARNDDESEKWYLKSAEQGNADAMYSLGGKYMWKGLRTQLDASQESGSQTKYEQKSELWYKKAADAFKKLADQGDSHAMKMLGDMYSAGTGVEEDENKVHELYLKAAEHGDPDAECEAGNMYLSGSGVIKDLNKALDMFQKSAEQGNANAMFGLGNMYREGQGVRQDYEEAAKWYAKSADMGAVYAMTLLAGMYRDGQGVGQNYEEAAKWFGKAAEQDNSDAMYELGKLYINGTGVKQDNEEALKWYKKAAEKDNSDAQYCLGDMFENGAGVEQSRSEARKWFGKAAENGNEKAKPMLFVLDVEAAVYGDAEAQFRLAERYADPYGFSSDYTLEQDNQEAVKWYRKAAWQGHAEAQYKLGQMYSTGEEGVEQNDDESEKWYLKAAEQGHADAQKTLGMHYRTKAMTSMLSSLAGESDPSDKGQEYYEHESDKWFQKAVVSYKKRAAQDDTSAMCRLGEMYYAGNGVEEDHIQAEKWYRMAAERGDYGGRAGLDMLKESDS